MAENSKIEWTDHTFNPWTGCTKVSPGCDGCYAEAWAKRSGTVRWGVGEPRRRTTDANWRLPLKWNRQAEAEGRRFRVFCASLADVFDNAAPTAWRADLFQLIADTPHLDWLLLTKRIGNAEAMLPYYWAAISNHVWIGATVVNQVEADRDIPKLLAVPAAVRFLSMEPLLGPIDLLSAGALPIRAQLGIGDEMLFDGTVAGIDWVICGGESGPKARPMHPDWARSLRDQCAAAGVPFLFKQWGEWHPESSANYAIGAGKYRYGRVEGISMMPGGEICVRNAAEAPASRPTIIDGPALQAWHDRCRCAEGKPDAENYPFGYQWMHRIGKQAAGRLLDGVEHNGFPASAQGEQP